MEIILEELDEVLSEQLLHFFLFKASNIHAKYETFILGMPQGNGMRSLMVISDLQLVKGQVSGSFQARKPHLSRYLTYVKSLPQLFCIF